MIQKLLCLAVLCVPYFGICQQSSPVAIDKNRWSDSTFGIKWAEGLTWQQVKQKAKKENKYIFVDCYATWCKPCKQMDKEVYTVDSVGNYLNERFISVKLQMDVTKNDNEAVRSWRKTAKEIESQYRINAYPSYIFFAPGGEVVTKEIGYKDPASFLQVARNATDPSKQYFVLLRNYKKGKLDDAAKRSLISTAKNLNDTVNYRSLRDSYFAYLHALPKQKLYTKENIEFIASIISRRSQPVFDMFYPDGSKVDKVMEKNGYARKVVDDIIMKEKVSSVLNAAMESKIEPDWSKLLSSIAKDYKGDYAGRNVMEARMKWWQFKGDALKYANVLNDKMEKYGSDTTDMGADFQLNSLAYLLWMDINDFAELKRIANWMAGVVRRSEKSTGEYIEYRAYYMDTYANLLYKLGENSEALKWQEMAVTKGRELNIDKDILKGIEANFEKMNKGEPTWPIAKK